MTTLTEPLDIEETEVPDVAPPAQYDYACEVCGKELIYAGKGRKPTRCDEHKRTRATSASAAKSKGANAQLAAQAADTLYALNGTVMLGLSLPIVGLYKTAGALADRNDAFRENAYTALLTDPALCRAILKAQGMSGKLSLLTAYVVLAAAVAPVAVMEVRARQAHPENPMQGRAL